MAGGRKIKASKAAWTPLQQVEAWGSRFVLVLPVVGLGITALGVGYDTAIAGKDPTTSIASGAGGYLAGGGASAAVLAAGGPVGWAVGIGAVASIGVGFAIEEWGDDAVDLAGDAASAVGDWASDLF